MISNHSHQRYGFESVVPGKAACLTFPGFDTWAVRPDSEP